MSDRTNFKASYQRFLFVGDKVIEFRTTWVDCKIFDYKRE